MWGNSLQFQYTFVIMEEITTTISETCVVACIDQNIYEKEAILQSCYKFTNNFHINIQQFEGHIEVQFKGKNKNIELGCIALEFENELIDQQIRLTTSREFKSIREELFKKAFLSVSKLKPE